MNIQVTPHTIAIAINTNINAGEYNITPCEFTFTEEYEDLTKEAIFSSCDGSVFKVSILNNQCTIPYEVLQQEGNVLLGVYAYETNDDELVLRYSPTPQYFNVKRGSFQVGNDPDLPSPTEWERVLEQINQAIEETNNLNITANKEGKITTVTITKKDGTTQEVEINDGKDLEFNWEGTSLGVRQEGQSEYEYTDLKGAKGDTGATPNIQIGDVQTGDSSEVTRTGTDENPIFNFTLEKGETGNGIASITKTSTSGLVDTYTITFTNGQTTTYEITNGANGDVVDVQVDGTSVVDNGIANIIGLTEMKQELEDMYNLLPKVQGTGETITLDGTVAGKMLVDLKGNTSQETTTGVNLFTGKSSYSKTIQNVEFTISDSKVTINGQSNNSGQTNTLEKGFITPYQVDPSTVYTYKVFVLSGSFTGTRFAMNLRSGSTDTSTSVQFNVGSSLELTSGTNSATFTSSSDSNYLTGLQFIFSADAKFTNLVLGVELVKGNTEPTTYEPYTNGPSPNPDYPQDIHVVSGDNTINVCGKNLFKLTPYSDRGITFEENSNGTIKIYGTATTAYCSVPSNKRTNCNLEAGTYTYSRSEETTARVGISLWFEDGTSESKTIVTGTSLTFTTTKRIVQYGAYLSGLTANTSYNYNIGIQLEKNEEKTSFEPYQSQSYPINLGVENLFNNSLIDGAGAYQVSYSVSDEKITINSTSSTGVCFCYIKPFLILKPNTTYTLSFNCEGNLNKVRLYDEQAQNYIDITTTGTTRKVATFTTNTHTNYRIMVYVDTNKSVKISDMQLEKGSKANSYTPFGTTPIELCKIGDYQDSIKKSTGKNLFDKNNDITVNTGLTSEGGTFSSNDYCMKGWLELKANTQYTLSDNDNTKTKRICFYSDKTESSFISVVEQVNKSVTFTTPANCKYVRIQIKQTELNYEMLNEGSTALSYEPYGKVWYKYEIISKYIINSSNDFRLYDATNYPGRFYRDNFWTSSYPSNLGYMTHFKRETYTTGFGILSDGSFAIQTPNHRLWIINLSTPTLEEFNTWLSTNNVTFYRVLKTPTYTEITDSTLISQLETIKRSYNGQTNISQTNDDKPFILDVTALKELTQ